MATGCRDSGGYVEMLIDGEWRQASQPSPQKPAPVSALGHTKVEPEQVFETKVLPVFPDISQAEQESSSLFSGLEPEQEEEEDTDYEPDPTPGQQPGFMRLGTTDLRLEARHWTLYDAYLKEGMTLTPSEWVRDMLDLVIVTFGIDISINPSTPRQRERLLTNAGLTKND